MPNTTLYTERKFLGKSAPFASKEEAKFEKRHLEAYLKGHERFQYGFTEEKNSIGRGYPIWHTVKQEVTIDTEKKNY